MTNTEYEAASIAAAIGGEKLRLHDAEIAKLEAALAKAQEMRREIVNQYNLNKGGYITDTKTYVVGEECLK